MRVKIMNRSLNDMPAYATEGSAGMDLRANLRDVGQIHISPGARALIPTGVHLQLPKGYEAQVRPRSGLAWKMGVTVLNSPGTIDSDYIGEVGVILINHGHENFVVADQDKIAQLVVAKYETVTWHAQSSLEKTERGEGGFGSTGTN